MLIKVIDHKAKEHWVNPAYIRRIAARKDGKCTIDVSGWTSVLVSQSADEVAGLINIALQEAARLGVHDGLGPAQLAEQQSQAEAQQAAMIGAIVVGG